jgi:ABC-type Zn2+ transport system substrate-binding protein/surface adhesin
MFLKNFKLLSRVNNNLLIKNINLKFFSGSHGNVTHNSMHDNNGQASTPHDENNHDHHDHHDHHGHHEITGEVDFQKVYLPVNSQMKRYISLTGTLHNNREVHKVIEGDMKARNSVTPIPIPLISRNRVFYKDLANVSYEENTYFHPEPYGYLISDDVKYFIIIAMGS